MSDTPPPGRAPAWRRAVRVITAIEIAIGATCLVVILALVFFQAVQRYLPIAQIAWTGEISRFCLVWLTFSVAGVLITTRGHIALEIVDGLRSPMAVRIVQAVSLVIVAVIAVLLVFEAAELIRTQGIIRSSVLRIPMSWVYVPLLVGVCSTAIRSLALAGYVAARGPLLADVDDEEVVA
ncbi:TRAP transporter small permease [Microbacterium karelineae]|uniref:TRAP transporter small permease n=1 Tax=Microbacterium karelineae TaxID=2654283 RepID=UPI0018D37ED7|nr:TRAP transporter small permease [Microbacterium karelineae]